MTWAGLFDGLIRRTPPQTLAAGALLFSRGDSADRLFYLTSGAVKLFTGSASGAENILHVFRAGDFFGLPAMVGLGRYPVSAETMEPTALVVLRRNEVQTWMAGHPGGAAGLLRVLGERYVGMVEDLSAIKALSPRQRLCRYLLRQAMERGHDVGSGPVQFTLTERHAVIAARIGLTPENLSRAFARLRGDGVMVRCRAVTVADMAALHALAEAPE